MPWNGSLVGDLPHGSGRDPPAAVGGATATAARAARQPAEAFAAAFFCALNSLTFCSDPGSTTSATDR